MIYVLLGALFLSALFLGIFFMMYLGRSIRARLLDKDIEPELASHTAIQTALFGLLGLVLAFSFSGAAARFDTRRQLIVEEANCISTAYLRLDLLPAEAQQQLRENFRQYVDARLSVYRAIPDFTKVKAELNRAKVIQGEIWTKAVAASQQKDTPQSIMVILLPALNNMFDIANTRYMAAQMHPPLIIFLLISTLILVCSLLTGFSIKENKKPQSWLHIFAFAALIIITFYTIVELEFPRIGLIHVKNFDQAIVDARNNM